ncbi:MAG TPA: tetratricopeptide repeat protein [Burkholderiaceae bacterium]|nr:tetratricopeptide repeat protein [Burkholderiaceae bacterium]
MKAGRRAVTAGLAALAWCPAALHAIESSDGPDAALQTDADYAAGMAALKAGDFGAALQRFERALRRFPEAADLHNELGFTNRKLRRMERAFEHYKRALAIDPRHRGAHEYIGEAYLTVGDLAGAERHVAELRSICLLPCDELKELEQAVAAFRATGQRPS